MQQLAHGEAIVKKFCLVPWMLQTNLYQWLRKHGILLFQQVVLNAYHWSMYIRTRFTMPNCEWLCFLSFIYLGAGTTKQLIVLKTKYKDKISYAGIKNTQLHTE